MAIRGNIIWQEVEGEKVPKFVPDPNGKFNMMTNGDTTIFMTDWNILNEK